MSISALLAVLALTAGAQADPMTTITAAVGRTCATRLSGSVYCWGKDYITHVKSKVPAKVPGISGATAVASGYHYNCALLASGSIVCWGDDGHGQLGDGKTEDSLAPVAVLGISDATAISAGGYHACALRATGGVLCWGRSLRGSLGNGSTHDSSTPVPVSGLTNAVAISAGYHEDESCAALATGRVVCWGSNTHGQLGDGTKRDSSTPVVVGGLTHAVGVAAGGTHACAVLSTGKLYCWGSNASGELGVGGSVKEARRPMEVRGLGDRATRVSTTARYTCAVLASGPVDCWGSNIKGTLGDGRLPVGSRVPVTARGITNGVAVTTSDFHACALLSTGAAKCWGGNDYGVLGTGSPLGQFSTPQLVR